MVSVERGSNESSSESRMSTPMNTPVITSPIPSSIETHLIAINAATQIPEKLTSSTFPQWHAQSEALLIGYDLMGYIDGTLKCPDIIPTSSDAI